MGWVLVAGEYNIEVTFLVVPSVNEVKEQPGILLVELAAAHFVNNEAGRPHQTIEDGCFLAGPSGSGKLVAQLRHLNETGFHAPLAALIWFAGIR